VVFFTGELRESGSGLEMVNPSSRSNWTRLVGNCYEVLLDRRRFVDRVCEHFEKYIGRLRNPLEIKLRSNFEESLRLLHGENMPLQP